MALVRPHRLRGDERRCRQESPLLPRCQGRQTYRGRGCPDVRPGQACWRQVQLRQVHPHHEARLRRVGVSLIAFADHRSLITRHGGVGAVLRRDFLSGTVPIESAIFPSYPDGRRITRARSTSSRDKKLSATKKQTNKTNLDHRGPGNPSIYEALSTTFPFAYSFLLRGGGLGVDSLSIVNERHFSLHSVSRYIMSPSIAFALFLLVILRFHPCSTIDVSLSHL